MADSVTVSSNTVAATARKESEDVWEIVISFFTDTGAHVEGTTAIPLNGIIQKVVMALPATTATGSTSTFTIDDNENDEIFNSGAQAENATYTFNLNEPVSGTLDFSLDVSKDPTGSGVTNVVTIRGI